MTTVVRQLNPGDHFILDYGRYGGRVEYKLIYSNECRAYVEPVAKKRDPLDDSGGTGRINISPNVDCIPLDEDLEDFMGTATHTEVKKRTVKKDDNKPTGKEPYKQERPVKEGTIRANLLAAIKAGESNLDKLAKKFGTPRSNVVSHIRDMWRFHGYGFSITGDMVTIKPPVGGALKTKAAAAPKPAKTKKVEKDLLDDDDDFLS